MTLPFIALRALFCFGNAQEEERFAVWAMCVTTNYVDKVDDLVPVLKLGKWGALM